MGFYVETEKRPTFRPVCGRYTPSLVIYKSRKQTVRGINVLGKCTVSTINRHYYKCRECSRRSAEPLESVGDNERITKKLRTTSTLSAPYCPPADLECEYQISDIAIQKIFMKRVNALPKPHELEIPEVLGIDKICLVKDDYHCKQPWAITTNDDKNIIMEILCNRGRTFVTELLQPLKNSSKVEVAPMDMWSDYRTAVDEVLSKALVVVGKLHAAKMANEQMGPARKYFYKYAPYGLKESKSLFLMREDKPTEETISCRGEWFGQHPKLKTTCALKESLYRIYDCSTRFEAERTFREWQWQIPNDTDFNGW